MSLTHSFTSAAGSKGSAGTADLSPLNAQPLPLGAIQPAGWLRRQLQIQAQGLSGHLDEFWPDVAQSSWIGGKAEGWERGPYWLDGFIPLAFQLDDPQLKARAQRWVDYILQSQCEDGWLGPIKGNPSQSSRLKNYDVWPRFILLKALTQWQEATGDARIVPAMTRFFHCLDQVLDQHPLQEWARVRWADLSLSIYWLYDRTGDPWLLQLAAKVHQQGLDWPKLARNFPYRDKITEATLQQFKAAAAGHGLNDQFGATHGVNLGMGVKTPGVWSRQSKDPADRQAALTLLRTLDQYHGQATGMFSCDEHLAGRHPSQGTELCTVVELMFSLETLLSIQPEVALADRLESIAYNALPATFKDDMWAHQYDQQANQVLCQVSPEHIYSNNGPEANLFGLEPNFGCCLANLHQGWPKFTSHLWMQSHEGGLVAMTYAPCDIQATLDKNEVKVNVQTDYPFNETIDITVTSAKPARFPLDLRIPAWAQGATISLDNAKALSVRAGTFHRLNRKWSGQTHVRLTLPMQLRVERRVNDSVTLHRGPLIFALKVGQDWRKLRDRQPTADWAVLPTTPWNYALQLDPSAPEKSLRLQTGTVPNVPFSSEAPPLRLFGQARRLPDWTLVKNAAAAPPQSPVISSEPVEPIELIPYGAAKLRVTELPLLRPE
ncbi:MAG TPA: beta-L-arabinofuranosidase domain-containing protein [Bacillota bacterium]|nr:beta-L-arabinofuranosidase domain-containing protein [Bacillota bacterium]